MRNNNRGPSWRARLSALWWHAPATVCLIVINIAVFVAMAEFGIGVMPVSGKDAIGWGSNYAPYVADGQWWRLITAMFVHLGPLHIATNMYALYQAGQIAERLLGSLRYILLYLFTGIVGNMISDLWSPQINGAGASGAIFGIFGALAVFMAHRRWRVSAPALQQAAIGMIFLGIYALIGGFTSDHVDNVAHLGGLGSGMVMGLTLARPLNIQQHFRVSRRQLMVACIGGLMVFAALTWPLMHPSPQTIAVRQFRHVVGDFHSREMAALGAEMASRREFEERRLSPVAYAKALEHDALPAWQSLYRDIAALTLPPGLDRTRQQLLLRYVIDRRDAIAATIHGYRESDFPNLDVTKEKNADAETAIAELDRLSGS